MKNKIKRKLMPALALIAALSLETASHAESFSDLDGHWAKESIEWMVSKGFLKGYPEKVFKPNDSVTRAEFAAMIVKAGTFERESFKGSFTDVNPSDWHATYIETAFAEGWIKGSDGKFYPNEKISRAEMGVIMGRIVKAGDAAHKSGLQSVKEIFSDSLYIPAWAHADLAYTVEHGIMKGKEQNRFDPLSTSTRAEAATVVYNALMYFGNVD